MIIFEDSHLYRGIFWITNVNDIESTKLYFQIPCDSNGDINDPLFIMSPTMSSTNSDNYNHERVWSQLSKDDTNGKSFNYYPRGRVEIYNGVAKIFHSPRIDQDQLKAWAISKFNLTTHNGIKKIRMIADGSEHYRCYLD